MSLPLPLNYFDCPRLTAHERETYLSFGEVSCRDTVQNALSIQNHRAIQRMKNKRTKQTAIIYSGKDVVDPTLPVLCAKTQVHATLDEIAKFFFLDSTDKLSSYSSSMGQQVLDRQNLYTLASPASTEVPIYYCGIAWFAFETPLSMLANRDFCVIEYHNEIHFVDSQMKRRRGWVRCIQSINLRNCPPLKATHGLVRGSLTRTGQVFLETDTPGLLDFYSVVVAQSCGNLQVVVNEVAKRQVQRAIKFEEQLMLYRLMQQRANHFLSGVAFERFKSATACIHCLRRFSWMNKKQHCRQCNEIACIKCGHEWTIYKNDREEKIFVCRPCFAPPESRHRRSMQNDLSMDKVQNLRKLVSPREMENMKTIRGPSDSIRNISDSIRNTSDTSDSFDLEAFNAPGAVDLTTPDIMEFEMVTETQRNLTILLEYANAR
ncbi:hypothetical protein AC1031_018009 [Aphanomyces cochlioides]|nr:hypothetical protein AC1031_018009 [Aphanomyces cochlioides]